MSRTTLCRFSLVLILASALSLAPRPSWAATGQAGRSHSTAARAQAASSLLSQAWNHLVSVWSRAGSAIDPNGVSISAAHTPVAPVPHNGN